MNLTEATDKELVASVQEGDNEAFGELYTRYYDIVRNTLIKKTGSSYEDAEDITQQGFVKAMKNIASFQNRSSFKTWVYRITHNVFLDSLKSKKRYLSLNEIEEDENGKEYLIPSNAVDYESPFDNVSREDQTRVHMDRINNLKEKLSDVHQQVFDKCLVEDKSYKEAAEELDCPIGTVMSRLFFARKKMQKLMDKNPIKTR